MEDGGHRAEAGKALPGRPPPCSWPRPAAVAAPPPRCSEARPAPPRLGARSPPLLRKLQEKGEKGSWGLAPPTPGPSTAGQGALSGTPGHVRRLIEGQAGLAASGHRARAVAHPSPPAVSRLLFLVVFWLRDHFYQASGCWGTTPGWPCASKCPAWGNITSLWPPAFGFVFAPNHYWQCLGANVGCWGMNPGRLRTRQVFL